MPDDARAKELATQCAVLQAATAIAWGNVLESYKSAMGSPDSAVNPEPTLAEYWSARALQLAAEQALLNYLLEARGLAEPPGAVADTASKTVELRDGPARVRMDVPRNAKVVHLSKGERTAIFCGTGNACEDGVEIWSECEACLAAQVEFASLLRRDSAGGLSVG